MRPRNRVLLSVVSDVEPNEAEGNLALGEEMQDDRGRETRS